MLSAHEDEPVIRVEWCILRMTIVLHGIERLECMCRYQSVALR